MQTTIQVKIEPGTAKYTEGLPHTSRFNDVESKIGRYALA
jgi:hypothetical protein